jgi:hypothetical protein
MSHDPKYARLSLEAGMLAGKLQKLTGEVWLLDWLRLNGWDLTREMLEELKQRAIEKHGLPAKALELSAAERAEIEGVLPEAMRLQRELDNLTGRRR